MHANALREHDIAVRPRACAPTPYRQPMRASPRIGAARHCATFPGTRPCRPDKELQMFRPALRRIAPWCFAALALPACAQEAGEPIAPEDFNAHVQATYIRQRKDAFDAPYSGARSLSPEREMAYSFSATAAIGLRPWRG